MAVKRGLANEVALPPSIVAPAEGLQGEPPWEIWNKTIKTIDEAYNALVDAGVPAEDARGLLPHATTTRIIYHTNLRALFEHAGNRLCTQAQFEWRIVFAAIIKAIREYGSTDVDITSFGEQEREVLPSKSGGENWQWQLIAQPKPHTFTPICYRLGRCAFKSELDRGCSIRSRVDAFERHGVPSNKWHETYSPPDANGEDLSIHAAEWLTDPRAGMTRTEWGQTRPEATS